MAKKTNFEIRPDSFDESRLSDMSAPTHTGAYTHTHEATHKHTHVNEPVAKVFKKKRVQLLTYESLIEEVDKYAAERGVSRVAVVEVALRKFLDEVNKAKQ